MDFLSGSRNGGKFLKTVFNLALQVGVLVCHYWVKVGEMSPTVGVLRDVGGCGRESRSRKHPKKNHTQHTPTKHFILEHPRFFSFSFWLGTQLRQKEKKKEGV